jgi:phosphoribosylanthranilate isomerase
VSVTIKICGITRVDDALAAAEAGADIVGFVFADGSPRAVSPQSASRIAGELRQRFGGVRVAGVFRDATAVTMRAIAREVPLDLVQLHGDEDRRIAAQIGAPLIRAFRVSDRMPSTSGWEACDWYLFDALSGRAAGGTGETFDWTLLERPVAKPFFVAGGLAPDNVGRALAMLRPDGVDVASGVESAPGRKDRGAIVRFVQAVRRAEALFPAFTLRDDGSASARRGRCG